MATMHLERERRALAIVGEAMELPPHDRVRFVEEQCDSDIELRSEVNSLLEMSNHRWTEVAPSLESLKASMPGSGSQSAAALVRPFADAPIEVPEWIGRYRILGVLGTGGMGVVYRAEQSAPQRLVALKTLHRHLLTPRNLARFQTEIASLAQLNHPNIAQLYDAGVCDHETMDERPFLVMELVEGQPLLHHAAKLKTNEKLALFARVCDGVAFAHQRGIIHRDLKPSNVLVTDAGEPKVLDFGVVRLTAGVPDVQMTLTSPGEIVGTLAYMSPERLDGASAAPDVRWDVYSLGAMLYELLADRLPIEISGQTLLHAALAVRDTEPVPLSRHSAHFRGDLERIVTKALAKDVDQRYSSVAALADDVRRFLANLPTTASDPSFFYRFRKFARRHRAVVAMAAVAGLAVLAGIVGLVHGLLTARSAATRQQRVLDSAIATVSQISLNVLPELNKLSGTSAVRDQLIAPLINHQAALREFAGDNARLTAARADAIEVIADLELGEGRTDEALSHRMEALELRARLAAEHPHDEAQQRKLAINHVLVGDIWKERSEFLQAESRYKQAMTIQRALADAGRPSDNLLDDLAWSYCRLADLAVMRKDSQEVKAMMSDGQQILTQLLARDPNRPGLSDLEQQFDVYFAWLDRESGNYDSWLRRVDQRLSHLRSIIAEHPFDRTARYRLCGALLAEASWHHVDAALADRDLSVMGQILDECASLMTVMIEREPTAIETREIQVLYGVLRSAYLVRCENHVEALALTLDTLQISKKILETPAPPFVHYSNFRRLICDLHDLQQVIPNPRAAQIEAEAVEYFKQRCADSTAPAAARTLLEQLPTLLQSDMKTKP